MASSERMRPVSISSPTPSTESESDARFLAEVEAATHPGEQFNHRAHVRLAWLCLRESPFEAGLQRIRELIRHYATSLGAAGKYHETQTRAWALAVWNALQQPPRAETFTAFTEAHPELLDSKLLARHYRPETLQSPAAKETWVAPDREPLPEPR